MALLTAAAVLALASQYSDWDPQWVTWQVLDAGTGHGESSGKTDALNPAGPYRGLMQIWDANAERFGYAPLEMYDARKNLEVAHLLWLERGTAPWPSAVKYPGASTMANGICPFARQVYGVTTFSPGNGGRVGFCDHAAGGFFGTMLSSAFWNGAGTSVHFAISRDGEVAQLVNIFDTAFAQGRLGPSVTWPPYAAMGSSNPNGYLISTEHEDWTLVNGKATAVPGSQWTAAEYAADLKVKRWAIDEVKRVTGENLMRFGLDSLAGHFMFDGVNRRECPGLYWTQDYRQRLFNDLTSTQTTEEIMPRFNAVAPRLQKAQTPQVVQLTDFDQPLPSCKRLKVEVYLNSGRVILTDSDGRYAGRVGWDGSRYGVVDVDVSGGNFTINGDPNAELAQVGVVAYA